MSKVSVTFTDNDAGTVDVDIDFDPPGKAGDVITPAQHMALNLLRDAGAVATDGEEEITEGHAQDNTVILPNEKQLVVPL